MPLDSIIRYFRDCYKLDHSRFGINNIFSKDIEGLLITEGQEELITRHIPYIPIPEEYFNTIKDKLDRYSKEKELIYFSFLLIGLVHEGNKQRKVIAPLVYTKASLFKKNDLHFLEAKTNHQFLNTDLLRPFRNNADENSIISVDMVLPDDPNEFSFFIDQYFTGIDTSHLLNYPNLFNENKIKRLSSPKELSKLDNFQIIPASGAVLIKKSTESMGVLNELTQIAKHKNYSDGLKELFQYTKPSGNFKTKINRTSAVLSQSQIKSLQNANTQNISLIIGPPGTGKSFTIANMAIEQLSQGKKVLIVSRTNRAVDVIANKIEKELQIDNILVRGGRQQYLRDLKDRLQNLLSGIRSSSSIDRISLKLLNRSIDKNEKGLLQFEKQFTTGSINAIRNSRSILKHISQEAFWSQLAMKYIIWKHGRSTPIWALMDKIESTQLKINNQTTQLIKDTFLYLQEQTLTKNRKELNYLNRAIRARTGNKQEEYFNKIDFDTLLKAYPIWLVNMKDVFKVLPLKKHLFDLAIIDEATQCDIASTLPVIQRAKRTVVVGDPKQLRHISFLSKKEQQKLYNKYDLSKESHLNENTFNYRKESIIDLVNDSIINQNNMTFLNEHFRSTPAIIRFSNKHIYNNAISIMTKKPELSYNHGITPVYIGGSRDLKGINQNEAQYIIERINEISTKEQDIDKSNARTIGILSPFRNQADFLSQEILRLIPDDTIKKHDILIGTAYEFQGEEKDVMLISLCVDNQSHSMAFHHINKPDVFNVSITRARSRQEIIYSFKPQDLKPDTLLRKYIDSILNHKTNKPDANSYKDDFLNEVNKTLQSNNVNTWIGYEIAGLEIDILAKLNKATVGFDLVGYPGKFEDVFSIERYKILNRTGIKMVPIDYPSWLFNKAACIEIIQKYFKQ